MAAVRAVGVVGRVWFRFGRHSFQGAFFFDFFRFFPFFLLFFSLLPFPDALARFLPRFPFCFLDARRRNRGFRLRPASAGADRCGNRNAQRHEKRPLGADLLKLWRHGR